jgi:hypothetical protein
VEQNGEDNMDQDECFTTEVDCNSNQMISDEISLLHESFSRNPMNDDYDVGSDGYVVGSVESDERINGHNENTSNYSPLLRTPVVSSDQSCFSFIEVFSCCFPSEGSFSMLSSKSSCEIVPVDNDFDVYVNENNESPNIKIIREPRIHF